MNNLAFFNKKAKKVCDNINNFRSIWPPKVEDKEVLNDYLDSREFVSNKNDKIAEIEKDLSNFLHTKYFSFFDSGASSIHSALIACNVTYGDEVIVPSWTFAAPAFQVLRVGAIPIFADIKPDTYNIDENDVIELLNKFKKVKAIIAVHMQGYPCNLKNLRKIADDYNIKLIEDCAQAFGAKIDDKYVGTYGDIGCFSFMPVKQLASCGELGGICTNNVDLFNNANSVKTYAQKIIEGDTNFYYNSFTYGYNYKPSALNSLYTQKQISQSLKITADVLLNKNNELYTRYKDKFYAIQEYIKEQNNTKIDIIEETSKNLYFLHQELKKLDKSLYKNKKEYSDGPSIKENIEKSRNELEKIKIPQEVKGIFAKLLNKRKDLLEKYICEYHPNEFQVIHRDIRLGNIIVNNNGIYFIDFDYVAYGDLLFEIGSASMLISNFVIERAKHFVNIYNSYLERKYKNEEIYQNLLAYYVQSDFPIKLINKVENDALIGFIENRIKCLDFCEKILYD